MMSRSDVTTLPSRSFRRRGRAWLTHPLTLGIVFGYVLLTLWSEYSTKWAAYICIGVFAAIAGPLCARAAGGMERFLFLLFIFCLQFSLSFNVTYFARDIPGGVQGLNVSLMTLLAACYVVAWMMNRYLGRTDRWHFQWSFVVACAVFFLTSALSFLTTPDHTLTIYGLVGNLSMVVIGIVAGHMCSTRDRIKTAAQVLLIVLITQSIICLIERATNT